MKIALISFFPVWEDKDASKKKAENLLVSISNLKIDWVIFPEMTLTGFTMNSEKCAEEFQGSQSILFFSECAEKFGIYISFGVALKKGGKPTNNLVTLSPNGDLISNYAKIHPFSYANEDKYYTGDSQLVSALINDIPVGMSICYDLRFPEIFQALSKSNEIIINIASWPARRESHWNTFLQARAIENQVFFIGVNRTGIDGNNIEYHKSSAIFDPEGAKLQPMEISPEVDIFKIDVSKVNYYRDSFPVKKDRKIDLYRTFYEA